MQKYTQWILGITFVVVGFAGLAYRYSELSNRADAFSIDPSTSKQLKSKHWTEVYKFKGNGMKKSPVFELTGGDARLKYKYQSQTGVGLGLFAVYVVDEGKDVVKTGGFPEVVTQMESEESESTIQNGSGRFYLYVNAVGSWTITVEEMK